MQVCPDCGRFYDDSIFASCPFCEGILGDGEPGDLDDPDWEFVYDEENNPVACPSCGAPDLRYYDGMGRCVECGMSFTDEDIEDEVGPWSHA